MIDGVRAVLLQVPDVRAAGAWYAKALEVQPFESQPGVLTFYLAGIRLVLQPAAVDPMADGVTGEGAHDAALAVAAGGPTREPPPAGGLFFLSTNALDVDLRRFIALGAAVVERPSPHDATAVWAVLRDPFGHAFGLMEVRDPAEARAVTQRVSEKIALRNIRATLDELQREEQQRHTLRRMIPVVALVAILGLAWLLGEVVQRRQAQAEDTLRPTLPLRAASAR